MTSFRRSRISCGSSDVVNACAARRRAPEIAASSSKRRFDSLSRRRSRHEVDVLLCQMLRVEQRLTGDHKEDGRGQHPAHRRQLSVLQPEQQQVTDGCLDGDDHAAFPLDHARRDHDEQQDEVKQHGRVRVMNLRPTMIASVSAVSCTYASNRSCRRARSHQ